MPAAMDTFVASSEAETGKAFLKHAGTGGRWHVHNILFRKDGDATLRRNFVPAEIGELSLLTKGPLPPEAARLAIPLCLPTGQSLVAVLLGQGVLDLSFKELQVARKFQRLLLCEATWRCGRCSMVEHKHGDVPKEGDRGAMLSTRGYGYGVHELGAWIDNPKFPFMFLPKDAAESARSLKFQVDWPTVRLAIQGAGHINLDDVCSLHSKSEADELTMSNGLRIKKVALVGMVVATVHTGLQYCVEYIDEDLNPASACPETNFSTYDEFFRQKHWRSLVYKEQPMLSASLLSKAPSSLQHISGDQEDVKVVEPTTRDSAKVPPELCRVIASAPVFRAAQLLPKVMHRMEGLLMAVQLRDAIASQINNRNLDLFSMPGDKILEAITCKSCLEEFSLERLEMLGDAILKYVVSCHLYIEYPNEREGQLSERRADAVSNATLFRHALSRRLEMYLRTDPMDKLKWRLWGFPFHCKACPHTPKGHLIECLDAQDKCGTCTHADSPSNDLAQHEATQQKGKRRTPDARSPFGDLAQREARQQSRSTKTKSRTITEGEADKGTTSEGDNNRGAKRVYCKAVPDMVESMIGAYWKEMGLEAAMLVMAWLGIPVSKDLRDKSLKCSIGPVVQVANLGDRMGYLFHNLELLQQAMTHDSCDRESSYQRLEFLGDAVLDYLVTRHIEQRYPDAGPGDLTMLRSAIVSNDNFAHIAVKPELQLHKYLRHQSEKLHADIEAFVWAPPKEQLPAPKILGDLLESTAAAILVDSQFDLKRVWAVMLPFFEPMATLETLEKEPIQQLLEFCQSQRLKCKLRKRAVCVDKYNQHLISVLVQGKVLASAKHCNKLTAKRLAARRAMKKLQAQTSRQDSSSMERRASTSPQKLANSPSVAGIAVQPETLVRDPDLFWELCQQKHQ